MSSIEAQPSDDKFLTFQNFVNGEVPIKEAVVYREVLKTNGVVSNRDWWRFGYQEDTWYFEHLVPDENDSSKLIAKPNGDVCGTSFTSFWTVSDKNIHTAAKDSAFGSVPESFNKTARNMMFSALSLGVPRRLDVPTMEDTPIEWRGLEFNTTVGAKFGKRGDVEKVEHLRGKCVLGTNDLPVAAEYPGVGELSQGLITYEYSSMITGLPTIFTIKHPDGGFRYEFLSLTLGTNDLITTNGYVPSLFATAAGTKIERNIMVWTNSLAYSLVGGKLQPAVAVSRKNNGTFIMIILVVVSATFLPLWYRRSKDKNAK